MRPPLAVDSGHPAAAGDRIVIREGRRCFGSRGSPDRRPACFPRSQRAEILGQQGTTGQAARQDDPVRSADDLAPGEDGFFTAPPVRDFDIHVDDAGMLPGFTPTVTRSRMSAGTSRRGTAEEGKAGGRHPRPSPGRHAPAAAGGRTTDVSARRRRGRLQDQFGDRRRVVEKVVRLGAGRAQGEQEQTAIFLSFSFLRFPSLPFVAVAAAISGRADSGYVVGGGMSTTVFFSEVVFHVCALPGNWLRPQPPLSGRKGHPRGNMNGRIPGSGISAGRVTYRGR